MLASWVFRPAAALAAAVLGARWLWLWWWPRWLGLGLLTPDLVLEALVLRPLALYESLAILPVGFLRRHAPALGGTLVVLMAMHGVLLRLFVEMLRALFARITFSRDPAVNFHAFWAAVRDHYAFLELRRVDWAFVRQLYGDAVQPATSDDDLLLALQESLALCDDPSLQLTVPRAASISSAGLPAKRPGSVPSGPSTTTAGRRQLAALAAQQAQARVLSIVERSHLADGGRRIANNFVCGILNAETSPGWRIGYIALTAMDGFVEFTLPRVDALMPSWTTGSGRADKLSASPPPALSVAIPELYDLESMRWSLEAILKGLGDVDGLILDLRFNRGGGSLVSALSVASFFATETRASLAFSTDEKLPSYGKAAARFSKRRNYYIPYTKRSAPYRGPLVVLQSQYTKGCVHAVQGLMIDGSLMLAF